MSKPRKTRTLLRELAGRASVARLAARFGRTPATVERWLKAGPPKGVATAIADAYERSEKARVAAARRHAEREAREAAERLKKELRAERRREAAAARRFDKFRKEQGPKFDGRSGAGHASLSAMISSEDPVWQAFVAYAESQGRTKREMYTQWYSPKLQKKGGKLRGKKRKKKPTRPAKRKPTKRKRR